MRRGMRRRRGDLKKRVRSEGVHLCFLLSDIHSWCWSYGVDVFFFWSRWYYDCPRLLDGVALHFS